MISQERFLSIGKADLGDKGAEEITSPFKLHYSTTHQYLLDSHAKASEIGPLLLPGFSECDLPWRLAIHEPPGLPSGDLTGLALIRSHDLRVPSTPSSVRLGMPSLLAVHKLSRPRPALGITEVAVKGK